MDLAKREAIMQAATHAFFDRGYAAASIEQIAQEAGVSKVTVYNHFGDKRGLFAASVEAECGRMRHHFSLGELPRGSLRRRLTAIGEALVEFLSRPEMVRFERRIAAETERNPDLGESFLEAGPHRMLRSLTGLLVALRDAGDIELGDPALAAEQFASLCKGIGDFERRFGRPNDEVRNQARIAGAVELFCKAYAAGDA